MSLLHREKKTLPPIKHTKHCCVSWYWAPSIQVSTPKPSWGFRINPWRMAMIATFFWDFFDVKDKNRKNWMVTLHVTYLDPLMCFFSCFNNFPCQKDTWQQRALRKHRWTIGTAVAIAPPAYPSSIGQHKLCFPCDSTSCHKVQMKNFPNCTMVQYFSLKKSSKTKIYTKKTSSGCTGTSLSYCFLAETGSEWPNKNAAKGPDAVGHIAGPFPNVEITITCFGCFGWPDFFFWFRCVWTEIRKGFWDDFWTFLDFWATFFWGEPSVENRGNIFLVILATSNLIIFQVERIWSTLRQWLWRNFPKPSARLATHLGRLSFKSASANQQFLEQNSGFV